MLRRLLWAIIALFAAAAPAQAQLAVKLDVDSARAVLAAVRNPALTRDQALAVARLPGNQGLIRKVRAYNRPADEGRLAEALLSAAQRRPSEADADYRFAEVRAAADKILPVLDALSGPESDVLDRVKARIALFTPARVKGAATGYLIVGGRSGGFAFGEPEFFLNLARYPSAPLASAIMAHELYHAVMGLAAGLRPANPAAEKCLAAIPEAEALGRLYDSLRDEGMASHVGDVLGLTGDEPVVKAARDKTQRGIDMVGRSVTLLALSTHALTSGSTIAYDDIYGLGFYGDEILYSLGHVMVRAIARDQGDAAVAELIDKPGAMMIVRYAALTGYGKAGAPALDPRTIEWARRLAACG
jgi:hypothetical protein